MTKHPGRLESTVSLALLTLLAVGCVLVLRPLASAVIVAALLTVSLAPLQERLVGRFKGRRAAAAGTVIGLCVLAAIVPLMLVGATLSDNAARIIAATEATLQRGLPPAPAWLQQVPLFGPSLFERWALDVADPAHLKADIAPVLAWLRTATLHGGGLLLSGVLQLTVAILLAFFLLRDGAMLSRRLETGLGRLIGSHASELLGVAAGAMRGVVYGLVGTAAAQGAAAAFAFVVTGVPGAVLLGFLTFVAAFIPLGAMLVWVPAAIWLFSIGAKGKALFLALWGGIVLLGMDKLLKPVLMSRGIAMPLALVIVGVLGGALAFGFLGLFVGPTLFAVAWAIASQWTAIDEAMGA